MADLDRMEATHRHAQADAATRNEKTRAWAAEAAALSAEIEQLERGGGRTADNLLNFEKIGTLRIKLLDHLAAPPGPFD